MRAHQGRGRGRGRGVAGLAIIVAITMPILVSQPALAADKAPGGAGASAAGEAPAVAHVVKPTTVTDLKSVFATVRSTDRIEARVRTPGTIASLAVDEGVQVKAGDVLAIVADQKLALRLKALDAQLGALKAQIDNAAADVGRGEELLKRGVTPKARLDEQRTQLEVLTNQRKSAEAERAVVLKQVEEGEVLAPASGRVLLVPVTVGSVVMAGESVATIAANKYILRLEVPERHAGAIKIGDAIEVGQRGIAGGAAVAGKRNAGKLVQVYPELSAGRVIADAEVEGLGDYFVGERVLVWVSAGERTAVVVPRDLVVQRNGYDVVRARRKGGGVSEVVVQAGAATRTREIAEGIEILAGLKAGDELVRP